MKNKRAFTLIELLVVIAIIGILGSLIFPAVNSARQKAQTTKCLAQLNQWGQAINGYLSDNGGVYPTSLAGEEWFVVLAPYAGVRTNNLNNVRPGDNSLFSCPSATVAEFPGVTGRRISYAMNQDIHVQNRTSGQIGVRTLRLSHLGKPGTFPVMFDSSAASSYGGSSALNRRHGRAQHGNILFADGRALTVTNATSSGTLTINWLAQDAM
ncbi:MAG TPA: type II secretion system protein [Kiritimatiellia bacterium]|nr:type II secretion system protein [Kiritimatiellia bacterium]